MISMPATEVRLSLWRGSGRQWWAKQYIPTERGTIKGHCAEMRLEGSAKGFQRMGVGTTFPLASAASGHSTWASTVPDDHDTFPFPFHRGGAQGLGATKNRAPHWRASSLAIVTLS